MEEVIIAVIAGAFIGLVWMEIYRRANKK